MQRAQVFLRDDQKKSLRTISARTGRKQSDLIRLGVDLVIEKEQLRVRDWKVALKNARGLWKDRDDIERVQTKIREGLVSRHKDLFTK